MIGSTFVLLRNEICVRRTLLVGHCAAIVSSLTTRFEVGRIVTALDRTFLCLLFSFTWGACFLCSQELRQYIRLVGTCLRMLPKMIRFCQNFFFPEFVGMFFRKLHPLGLTQCKPACAEYTLRPLTNY